MRYAIFSDLHDLTDGLKLVMADAENRQADTIIYLGDVGHDPNLFAALQQRGIACVFGNWEVSGYHHHAPALAHWISTWPARLRHDDLIFCHATPALPAAVTTTAEAARWMATGIDWNQLFPRLNHNEEARWAALAALEADHATIAFHGHTHIQEVWCYGANNQPTRRWRNWYGPAEFVIEPGLPDQPNRYLIGVGSAGAPQDGRALRYVIYDATSHMVSLVALGA